MPIVLTGSKESEAYFRSFDKSPSENPLGPDAQKHYEISSHADASPARAAKNHEAKQCQMFDVLTVKRQVMHTVTTGHCILSLSSTRRHSTLLMSLWRHSTYIWIRKQRVSR